MAAVCLNGANIRDWLQFHAECQNVFGFPATYGGNMDAWIDCLSYLRDADGMCKFRLHPDEILRVEILDAESMRRRTPEILEEMALCVDMINERYADYGEHPALELVLR